RPRPRAHGPPPVVVERAVPEHLEVLRPVLARRVRRVEAVEEALALDGGLGDAAERARRVDAERLENGGDEIDRVPVLPPPLAAGADAARPVHDERIADASPVRLPLPPAE